MILQAFDYICANNPGLMIKAPQIFLLIFLLSLGSCVPIKRLTYLQEQEATSDQDLIALQPSIPPYRLQVNDLLSIRIKALDQEQIGFFNPTSNEILNATEEGDLYFNGFVVDVHGNIRIPVIGELPVLGKTLEEVREDLQERLLQDLFKEESNLFITVKMPGIRFVITGEVGSPGSQIIYRDQVSLIEAIAASGDIPVTGDRTDVRIIRQYPLGQKIHHVDLTRLDAMNSPYYYIQPNDLIIVNPLPQKAWGFGTTAIQSFTTILGIFTALGTATLLLTR